MALAYERKRAAISFRDGRSEAAILSNTEGLTMVTMAQVTSTPEIHPSTSVPSPMFATFSTVDWRAGSELVLKGTAWLEPLPDCGGGIGRCPGQSHFMWPRPPLIKQPEQDVFGIGRAISLGKEVVDYMPEFPHLLSWVIALGCQGLFGAPGSGAKTALSCVLHRCLSAARPWETGY